MTKEELTLMVEEIIKDRLRITISCPEYSSREVTVNLQWDYEAFASDTDYVAEE